MAGKGIPAALLMTLLHGSLRVLVTAGFRGSSLVGALNAHLHANIPANRLVTLFYAELDLQTGRLRYINAGHNAPFLLSDHGVERLPATGVALGILPDVTHEEAETQIAPRARLFVFTDGVTEALDGGEQEYGEARLQSVLEKGRQMSGIDLVRCVEADVSVHCTGVTQYDDMTLLVVARD